VIKVPWILPSMRLLIFFRRGPEYGFLCAQVSPLFGFFRPFPIRYYMASPLAKLSKHIPNFQFYFPSPIFHRLIFADSLAQRVLISSPPTFSLSSPMRVSYPLRFLLGHTPPSGTVLVLVALGLPGTCFGYLKRMLRSLFVFKVQANRGPYHHLEGKTNTRYLLSLTIRIHLISIQGSLIISPVFYHLWDSINHRLLVALLSYAYAVLLPAA
jgi:hypothetical protein